MEDWKDLFYFTKRERRGIFVLVILIVLASIYPIIWKNFLKPEPETIDYAKRIEEIKQSAIVINTKEKAYQEKKNGQFTSNNEAESNSLEQKTGPKPKTVDYNKPEVKQKYVSTNSKTIILDINTASADDFAKLYGIGPVLSKRIITFREALGGFSTINQVGDTFGVEPETFSAINSQLKLENRSVRKLNFNTATLEQLDAHPYISPKLAEQIINYREKVGPYQTIEDVKKLYYLQGNDELVQKLLPYLRVSE